MKIQEALKRISRFATLTPGITYTFTEKDIEAFTTLMQYSERTIKTKESMKKALTNYKEKLKIREVNTDQILEVIKMLELLYF